MTLAEAILENLAKWRPHTSRETLEVASPETGWNVTVEADTVEGLGASIWELAVRRLMPPDQPEDLAARAHRVADRVTGLLEPLSLVEVDTQQGVAQLRSETPARRGEDRFYYEALLHPDGAAQVRRFRGPNAGDPRRQQVPFTLTHEALAKLADDLIV